MYTPRYQHQYYGGSCTVLTCSFCDLCAIKVISYKSSWKADHTLFYVDSIWGQTLWRCQQPFIVCITNCCMMTPFKDKLHEDVNNLTSSSLQTAVWWLHLRTNSLKMSTTSCSLHIYAHALRSPSEGVNNINKNKQKLGLYICKRHEIINQFRIYPLDRADSIELSLK